jgi:hypothetical protein
MNEKAVKGGVGRPMGSNKPKVSGLLIKLKIEVSQVQFKQLEMMVESGVGKSIPAIIEALLSADLMNRREAGKIGMEATIVPYEKNDKNIAVKSVEKHSQPNTTSAQQ